MRKDAKVVCEEYLDFIRRKHCLVCLSAGEPHHVQARGRNNAKRNDFTSVPLCRKHHSEIEQIGRQKFEELHEVEIWKEAAYFIIEFVALSGDQYEVELGKVV